MYFGCFCSLSFFFSSSSSFLFFLAYPYLKQKSFPLAYFYLKNLFNVVNWCKFNTFYIKTKNKTYHHQRTWELRSELNDRDLFARGRWRRSANGEKRLSEGDEGSWERLREGAVKPRERAMKVDGERPNDGRWRRREPWGGEGERLKDGKRGWAAPKFFVSLSFFLLMITYTWKLINYIYVYTVVF